MHIIQYTTSFQDTVTYSDSQCSSKLRYNVQFNPLNADLNPIYHLLALLGAHHILDISGIRVKALKGSYTNAEIVYGCLCIMRSAPCMQVHIYVRMYI